MGLRLTPFACLLAFSAGTVGFAAAEGPGAQRIRFHTLGIEHGLPQATARDFVQDRDGFVWIATQDGLARYDGHEFEVFRHVPGRAGGLGDSHITALAIDADGALWIGTQSGGLGRRDPKSGELRTLRHQEGSASGLAGNQITALLAENDRLHVATTRDVQIWTSERFQPSPLILPEDPGMIRRFRHGRDGSILVAAQRGAWRCRNESPCMPIGASPQGLRLDTHDILDEGPRGVWIAAEHGLFRFDAGGTLLAHLHADSQPPLASSQVRALLRDHRDRLWIGTMNGLSMQDGDAPGLHTWRHQPGRRGSLAASRVQSLLEDRNGMLWVGTWTEGLSLLDPRTESFTALTPDSDDPRALPGPVVPAVFADDDGSLWLGLLGNNGLVHFHPDRGLLARYLHDPADGASLSHNFVQHITRDRAGRLWVATQGGGLNRMRADGGGFERFRHDDRDPDSLHSDFLLHLHADRDNTLWISSSDRGLAALCDACDRFQRVGTASDEAGALGGSTVNSVFEDGSGRLWVALRPGGIALLDRRNMRFHRILAEPGVEGRLSSNTITNIFEDREGGLWFGTQGGGLYALQSFAGQQSRFRRYSRADGLGADAIGGVVEDDRGHLWISTTTGISRLDPDSGTITNFGAREGAQSSGYFINSHARLPDGRIAFGGLRGVTLFHPQHVPAQAPAGRVVLTRVTSHGARRIHPDPLRMADQARAAGRIELDHPANDLLLEFSALAFAAPDSVAYRYRLEGHDAEWMDAPARRRFAAYTNLGPGNYRFRVQAVAAGQTGPETVLALRVGGSPWEHPLAYALYALAALGILAVVGWQRLARWRDQARAQVRLSESEERLKLALWGSGDELWDIDLANGELRRENALPHIATPDDAPISSARMIRELMHPEDVPAFDEAFERHLHGVTPSLEVSYRVRDMQGAWVWLHCRGRIVERDADGKPLRIAGTIGDITDIKNAELELHALNQALEQRVAERTADLTHANEQLRDTLADLRLAQRHLVESEKMAALGGLVAGVAHEINTPIGIGVTAASHLHTETQRLRLRIASGAISPDELARYAGIAGESVEMILRNLGRADKLVRSFKQVAVDQGSEERREIEFDQYLDEILLSLRPALKRTRIEVSLSCEPALRLTTLPGAIYQIVVNLVMNSLIHAFEPDQEGRIDIEASRRDGMLLLSYADDGAGMEEAARRRIFEPFFTTRRGQGGSGLGMHIVYNLVTQALRGTIECDSAPGRGIYISIRLPTT